MVHQTMKINRNRATPASRNSIHIALSKMSSIRSSLLASITFAAIGLAGCTTTPEKSPTADIPALPVPVQPPATPLSRPAEVLRPSTYAALPGWGQDDLREAWPAFLASCEVMVKKPEWKESCAVARDVQAADALAVRAFFEKFLAPHQVFNPDGSDTGLVTGYYEPLLRGSRKRGGKYQTPLHRVPDDLLTIDLSSVYPELKGMRLRGKLVGNKVVPYPSRGEMGQTNSMAGKELLWVSDPVDAFFLQIQGSGRVQLADTKETVRVAYADQNGHPYRSIGRHLVDKGELALSHASAQGIKGWIASHPSRLQELLDVNPSYVFFKEEKLLDASIGPKGALGVPLTAQRSIAVDAQFLPLGAPVYLATTQPNSDVPLQRLMVAQDTGGAIRNAVRADYFWGFGPAAGEKAGKMKQRGAMWVLLPRQVSVAGSTVK
jgi:membrane-bound lytic murein transglycosylase A